MSTKDSAYLKKKSTVPIDKSSNKNASIQDTFFNQWRKDRAFITIYLINGIKLLGRIKSFDKYTIIIENKNVEQMIFKHAISTVSSFKPSSDGYPDFRPESGPGTSHSS